MTDYLIEYGFVKDVQKKLNQWKHDYELEILSFNSNNVDTCIILIKRTKK